MDKRCVVEKYVSVMRKKTLPVLNSVLAFSVCDVKSHIWSNVFYVELELFSSANPYPTLITMIHNLVMLQIFNFVFLIQIAL